MVNIAGFELQYIFSSKHDPQSQQTFSCKHDLQSQETFLCKHDLQSQQTFSCRHYLQSQHIFRANMTYNPNKLFRANMTYNPNKLFRASMTYNPNKNIGASTKHQNSNRRIIMRIPSTYDQTLSDLFLIIDYAFLTHCWAGNSLEHIYLYCTLQIQHVYSKKMYEFGVMDAFKTLLSSL